MRRRTKLVLFVIGGLLAAAAIAEWHCRPIRNAYHIRRLDEATSSLPSCDRIEVFHLDGETDADAGSGFPVRPYRQYSRILGSEILAGPNAEALASLWRAQTSGWGEFQFQCHYPGYGLRFYRGSALQFETSVCFRCRNFYVTTFGEAHWCGFDTTTPKADALLNRLQEIFPASVPKPKQNE